ncbi:GTP pyrophosphokinase [Paenibacillus xylanexedens]|uniref:PpGpp synthetase/RelA/SpoT-type nucleotidyltransferase n=1 Tax=Paenibacillus xylanexedens TaxID=528191 RepID=A0ABS4RMZ2_PAEXY|nr:RelA/SpoT domain-containing protein [Paenibacillus xylanexedens]MBP2244265.1 ppGpp synthetase/RelA/SpoT-type nucleotidyltransferase [Paenibacillus xylanexedens]
MENSEKNIDEIIKWYVNVRPTYKNLASKVESIIREVLNSSGISYYTVSSRAKDIESFSKKASKEKYKNPKNEIKDMAGIRIITFVKSEVLQCCDIIKPLFDIDPDHSVDKTKELGNDKVGYRSIHYVAKLTDERLGLPEYSVFKELTFEIQVRTILEHAWADISHDRNYKFIGNLPTENDIQRRFSLAAATLELVDREFDNLAKEINIYDKEVKNKVENDDLNVSINTTSLRNYLNNKFRSLIDKNILERTFNKGSKRIVNELKLYGIYTLADIDRIIGDDINKYVEKPTNYLGLLRYIMIINDINLYFEKAWRKSWTGIDRKEINYLSSLGVDIEAIMDKFELHVAENDFDYDEDDIFE